jgi:hypothetical protein
VVEVIEPVIQKMEKIQMKTARAIQLAGVVLLLGLSAWAQEFPRFEVAAD